MQNQSSSFTGFFGPTRRGYAAAADSSPGLCASDAQSPMREPLHNKIVTAVHRRRRQAPAASVFRIVAPLFYLAADLTLSTRSPDRSAAYYHDAFQHICQGSKVTSISPAWTSYETGGGTIRTKTHSPFR